MPITLPPARTAEALARLRRAWEDIGEGTDPPSGIPLTSAVI
ncbi:hypothetical protein [Microbacterium sp. KUDC0406]|nr:hypothetical protein [Microbacterium sp. KUDC0406]